MPSKVIDLESVELVVEDMTIHHGYPDIRVRMPISRSQEMQDWLYLEIRYRLDGGGKYILTYTPSPQLLENLAAEGRKLAESPPAMPDQLDVDPGFGDPSDFQIAARRLAEFHQRGGYLEHFAKYIR